MGEAHARLGPSNHRWPRCAGSVREEANYPDISGAAAIDGTGSHLLLEKCLIGNVRAESFDGHVIGTNHPDQPMGWLVSIDRIERVQMCLDYVARRVFELKEKYPNADVTVEAESRSDAGVKCGRTDWWGTVDITISVWFEEKILFIEICDYKDGRGWVHSDFNTQLMSYAWGKMPRYSKGEKMPDCRMTIVQPKTNPPVRYQELTYDQLYAQSRELVQAANRTDDPNAPLTAGKHCQWCKHKKNCSQQTEDAIERLRPMTNEVMTGQGLSLFQTVEQTFGDISTLPSDRLAELADARAAIEAAFDRVEAEIQSRIEGGHEVNGYAMVHGRGSTAWAVDEDEIVKVLKARRLKLKDIYPPKLISPAQVLKLPSLTEDQKANIQKKYIQKIEGALKLGKVERSAKPSAVDVFADVEAEPAAPVVSFF